MLQDAMTDKHFAVIELDQNPKNASKEKREYIKYSKELIEANESHNQHHYKPNPNIENEFTKTLNMIEEYQQAVPKAKPFQQGLLKVLE